MARFPYARTEEACSRDLIRKSIHAKFSGSIKISTYLVHISHRKQEHKLVEEMVLPSFHRKYSPGLHQVRPRLAHLGRSTPLQPSGQV